MLRSVNDFWNVGHIIGFAFLTAIIQNRWKKLATYNVWGQFFLLLLGSFLLGGAIELIQMFSVGRTASLMDVIRDLVGCFFAIAFFNSQIKTVIFGKKIIIRLIASFSVIFLLIPLSFSIIDDVRAYNQFPVIAGFESDLELTRFYTATTVRIDGQVASHGKSSLNVILENAKYPGIHLVYFPRNWFSFKSLKFSIYNYSEQVIDMSCRINDLEHNNSYTDRFNIGLSIKPGWNHISIPLADVKVAPQTREMDMAAIANIGIFSSRLEKPVEINIDNVRLSYE